LQITSLPENLDNLKTSGVDFEGAYRVPVDLLHIPGRLDLHILTTWVAHLITIDGGVPIDRAGAGANGGLPNWTTNFNVTYTLGAFTNNVQYRYTSAIKGDAALIGPGEPGYSPTLPNSINLNLFPSASYVDWYGAYSIIDGEKQNLKVFAGINNIANREPPFGAIIAFASGGNPYDVIGRVFKAGVRFAF